MKLKKKSNKGKKAMHKMPNGEMMPNSEMNKPSKPKKKGKKGCK